VEGFVVGLVAFGCCPFDIAINTTRAITVAVVVLTAGQVVRQIVRYWTYVILDDIPLESCQS
jgi:hypothetical protein